jgi:hypothetical protein
MIVRWSRATGPGNMFDNHMHDMVASIESVLIAFLIGFHVLLNLTRRDAWPFTRYPMFSRYRRTQDVRVVCVALEALDGSLRWWQPHFYRYTDGIGRKLADLSEENVSSCVEHVMRLLALEHEDLSWCKAVCVIERRWVNGAPFDRPISAIPAKAGLHTNCG